jgi:hypothetical protein
MPPNSNHDDGLRRTAQPSRQSATTSPAAAAPPPFEPGVVSTDGQHHQGRVRAEHPGVGLELLVEVPVEAPRLLACAVDRCTSPRLPSLGSGAEMQAGPTPAAEPALRFSPECGVRSPGEPWRSRVRPVASKPCHHPRGPSVRPSPKSLTRRRACHVVHGVSSQRECGNRWLGRRSAAPPRRLQLAPVLG